MASVRKEIVTSAQPHAVWDAIRDIGALHTRLVPGFVVDTRLEPGARIVTFANGMVMKETVLGSEAAAQRQMSMAAARTWAVVNPSAQNALGSKLGGIAVTGGSRIRRPQPARRASSRRRTVCKAGTPPRIM